ncbi:MAG: MoaD/ThiS family protein [Prolixibacteraceae bacterium]
MNEEVELKITCFAALRKYFSATEQIICTLPVSCSEIIEKLKVKNPEGELMLSKCRIAIGEQFVQPNFILNENVGLFLIPPSSGG